MVYSTSSTYFTTMGTIPITMGYARYWGYQRSEWHSVFVSVSTHASMSAQERYSDILQVLVM